VLVKFGAQVNAKNSWGDSPLCFAATADNPEAATELLKQGADIEHRGYMGHTPLLWAVWSNGHTILKYLLPRANAQAAKDDGDTILHVAAGHGDAQTMAILTEHFKLTQVPLSKVALNNASETPRDKFNNRTDKSSHLSTAFEALLASVTEPVNVDVDETNSALADDEPEKEIFHDAVEEMV
jgi:ankyrin repeat protein